MIRRLLTKKSLFLFNYLTLHSIYNTYNMSATQSGYKFKEIDNTTHHGHNADTSIRF